MNALRWTTMMQRMLQDGWNATFFHVDGKSQLYLYNESSDRELSLEGGPDIHKAMAALTREAYSKLKAGQPTTTTSEVPNENQEEETKQKSPIRNDGPACYDAPLTTPVDADASRIDPPVGTGPDSRIGDEVC